MEKPSIFGSAVNATTASSLRLRKRRTRATKSVTSSAAKAFCSDSMGTAWRILAKPRAGACAEAFAGAQFRETRLDLLVAAAQPIVFRVRDRRCVFLIITLVVLGDFSGKPLELGPGFRLVEVSDGNLAGGMRIHTC